MERDADVLQKMADFVSIAYNKKIVMMIVDDNNEIHRNPKWVLSQKDHDKIIDNMVDFLNRHKKSNV